MNRQIFLSQTLTSLKGGFIFFKWLIDLFIDWLIDFNGI